MIGGEAGARVHARDDYAWLITQYIAARMEAGEGEEWRIQLYERMATSRPTRTPA